MNIKSHFFGKDCIIDRALQNRLDFERTLAEKNIESRKNLFLNQIHGNEVVVIDSEEKIYGNQGLPKADGIVTNLSNVLLGIVTADCAPILFFDEEAKVIGAAHAGWRGARLGVIKSTVAAMKKLGAKNIKAKIGPMIQQESYEISQEFYDDFLSENISNKDFFINGKKPEKHWFNLSSYVEKKLREEGIAEIENAKIDTYKNEKDFFSFRRAKQNEEEDCGRNVSVVIINN
jgi:hypothetical protein